VGNVLCVYSWALTLDILLDLLVPALHNLDRMNANVNRSDLDSMIVIPSDDTKSGVCVNLAVIRSTTFLCKLD